MNTLPGFSVGHTYRCMVWHFTVLSGTSMPKITYINSCLDAVSIGSEGSPEVCGHFRCIDIAL